MRVMLHGLFSRGTVRNSALPALSSSSAPASTSAHSTCHESVDGGAVVIAETTEQAKDAAELVEIEYEVLDAVVDVVKATQDGASPLFDDGPNNVPFDWGLGDADAAAAAIDSASHVTTLDITNPRLIPNAIEPRSAIGD